MGKVASPSIVFKPAHPNNYAVGRANGGRNGQYTFHHVVGSAESAIAVFQNPNRQASSTFIISATPGLVYQMVSVDNTSYADGNYASNSRAITCEHHGDWRNGYWNETVVNNAAQLVAWLRDNGLINHYRRHREVSSVYTLCCADLPVEEIWNRATNIINAAYASNPTPIPTPPSNAELVWEKFPSIVQYEFNKQPTKLWDFNQTAWGGFGNGVKDFNQGDRVNIYGRVTNKTLGSSYLLTEYSYTNKITNGFNEKDLTKYVAPAPAKPEWELNRVNIEPIKLMVLATQTPIISLLDLSTIKQLGQGTWVDFTQKTTVQGKEYLISKYSADNGMPNGILKSDVGVPVQPPTNEKPAWLEKWMDIENVMMYTRADTDLVNLEDGSTIKVIPRGTKIEVSSTTEWFGHKYAITEYSTAKKEARGIRIDDLDMKPVENTDPVDPAPEQPPITTIDVNIVKAFLQSIVKLITDFIGTLGGKK